MSIGYSILVLINIFALPASAQINESDTTLFQFRASLTGNLQKGNVQIFTLRSKADISVAPSRAFVFKTQNTLLHQTIFKRKADEDIFSRNFIYFRPSHSIYPFAIGFVATNFRRKIAFRYFAGTGVTWQIVRQPKHILKLSAGIIYESSAFKLNNFNIDKYDGATKIGLWRNTTWLFGKHDLFDRHLLFYYDFYWQPAFADKNNYRYQVDIGLEFPIWKGLAFNALYTYTHENVVIQAIKPDDQILTFGLVYSLKVNHSK